MFYYNFIIIYYNYGFDCFPKVLDGIVSFRFLYFLSLAISNSFFIDLTGFYRFLQMSSFSLLFYSVLIVFYCAIISFLLKHFHHSSYPSKHLTGASSKALGTITQLQVGKLFPSWGQYFTTGPVIIACGKNTPKSIPWFHWEILIYFFHKYINTKVLPDK